MVAWTNSVGEQVAFVDYANANVADAGTISLPADVGGIAVDFASRPKSGNVKVCPAAGLTTDAVRGKVSVTVNGEPFPAANATVVDGNVYLHLLKGRKLMIR